MFNFNDQLRNKIFQILFFVIRTRVCSLNIPSVSIFSYNISENKMGLHCTVSTHIKSFNDINKIHLFCPFLDGSSCYINCDNQCLYGVGPCRKVFTSCNYVSNNESTINLYYQLDMRFVNVTGQWICQYDEQKSLPIEISKYVQPMETSTATQKITQKYESSTVTSMFSTTVLSFFPNFDLKMAIFVIISLGFSVIFNLILIGVVCITRKKFQRSRRRTKKKEISRDITETNSMLTRSSTHQQMLNRSNCSRTPSLDSPSFRESIATYLPDGSTIISANILPRESSSYYVDHCGRIIGILQPLNNYHLDTTDLMSRHSSGESASAFISAIHTNSMMPQKVSTHPSNNANWSHGTPQHQDSYSSTRACSSKQQVYGDSNDESGLGSQSLNHSIKQKHGSFCAGSDKVDLILDCDPSINNISRPPLNIQS